MRGSSGMYKHQSEIAFERVRYAKEVSVEMSLQIARLIGLLCRVLTKPLGLVD